MCRGFSVPAALQPFEEPLSAEQRADLLAVERGDDGKLHLLVAPGLDLGGTPGERYVRGPKLPDVTTLTPGVRGGPGGHWTRFPRSPSHRFFGPRVLACDFGDSPVVDRHGSLQEILEDRAGNLWFDTGSYFGARSIFVKRMRALEIDTSELPTHAKRSLTLTCDVTGLGADVVDLRDPSPCSPAVSMFWNR